MNITAIPAFESFLIDSKSASASFSASTAVGSSKTRSFILGFDISLEISVNCLWPTGIDETSMSGSRSTPSFSIASIAILCISFLSRVSTLLPKTISSIFLFSGSLFRTIFSVAEKSGSNENSWCTIPIPDFKAS